MINKIIYMYIYKLDKYLIFVNLYDRREILWDFPGDPVAKTLHSQCRGLRFNPWLGN